MSLNAIRPVRDATSVAIEVRRAIRPVRDATSVDPGFVDYVGFLRAWGVWTGVFVGQG